MAFRREDARGSDTRLSEGDYDDNIPSALRQIFSMMPGALPGVIAEATIRACRARPFVATERAAAGLKIRAIRTPSLCDSARRRFHYQTALGGRCAILRAISPSDYDAMKRPRERHRHPSLFGASADFAEMIGRRRITAMMTLMPEVAIAFFCRFS